MKKKVLMFVMAIALCFTLVACGGNGDNRKNDDIDPNATVTKEQYIKLKESNWSDLTPEEMERFLGVRYVENEESTKDWGEGYLVVDFPGPDEKSYLRVLFKDKEGDGKMTPSSISATGELMGD